MVVFCLIMYVTFISLVQLFLDVLETCFLLFVHRAYGFGYMYLTTLVKGICTIIYLYVWLYVIYAYVYSYMYYTHMYITICSIRICL